MKKTIIIIRRPLDWYAQIEGEPEKWGCGRTSREAVGQLVIDHPDDFKMVINFH